MAKKAKTLGINLPVPQNRDDAAEAVRIIGELNRDLARLEANMNDQLATIKEAFEQQAAPIREAVTAKTEGLKAWAEANRSVLTEGGKTKTADLGTGKVSWRLRPPSVRITKVDAVIEAIQRLGFGQFLRTKTEVNKEAILADRDSAKLIAGISIGSEGEDFLVEPFEVELAA